MLHDFVYHRSMCGRFVQAMPPEKIVDFFGVDPSSVAEAVAGLRPNYNVAPSQQIINVLAAVDEGSKSAAEYSTIRIAQRIRWGMIFPWAKSLDEGPTPINARVESVASKPAFRAAFAEHRSLVPADGFYEWKKEPGGGKTPYYIKDASGDPLAIAAIWSDWRNPADDSTIRSCTLITVPASPGLNEIHDRMPALLREEDFSVWLDPNISDKDALLGMLVRSSGAKKLEWYPVDKRVNSPRVNDPELIRPATTASGSAND